MIPYILKGNITEVKSLVPDNSSNSIELSQKWVGGQYGMNALSELKTSIISKLLLSSLYANRVEIVKDGELMILTLQEICICC